MQEPSDWELAARARDGEEESFGLLVTRYKQPALAFVYRMIGDAHEAQDVTQDVFVRLYRSLLKPGFEPSRNGAQFSTWLFQVARNAAIDVLRKRRRHPLERLAVWREHGFEPRDPAGDAVMALTASETGRRIAAAVARLPEPQRAVFVLADYEGQSYAEIAAVLRCSVKSVETRLYRARRHLRDWLAGER